MNMAFKSKGFKLFFILFCLVLVFMVYKELIWHIVAFDTNAPDLAEVDGVALKKLFFDSMNNISTFIFNFSRAQSFVFPVVFLFAGWGYKKTTEKLHEKTAKQLLRIKMFAGLYSSAIFYLSMLVILAVALVIKSALTFDLESCFSPQSVLFRVIKNTGAYLFFYVVVKGLAIFINTLFVCFLADNHKKYVFVCIIYILYMCVLSIFLYAILPPQWVPMTSLMSTSYLYLSVIDLILPYSGMLVVYAVYKLFATLKRAFGK